ncbi:MAG: YgcG family protein [Georgfuchsia sp.]
MDFGLRLLTKTVSFLMFAFLLFCLVSIPVFAADEVAIPPLAERVTDLTGTLTPEQKAQLQSALAQIETAKGAQVAILLLPTTQPETIEQFGIRLADAWKVGRKGVDDGAIVIVAKDDRRMRIEVGYGLEGAIPDVISKRIVSDMMAPRFKQGDFYGGLQVAVEAIGKIINGEALPPPSQRGARQRGGLGGNILPLAMVFIFVVGGILRAVLGRAVGASVGGAIAFFGAWLLLGSLFTGIIAALVAFVFTLVGGGRFGGVGMGGFGGGGFGGGGGGFSGGGGGFGGGGSSGSW